LSELLGIAEMKIIVLNMTIFKASLHRSDSDYGDQTQRPDISSSPRVLA
jgi:hypothetical protein